MMMRRSLSRAQQLREQLLQAIDSQYNIQNMAVVLDVIYCLEKYPMTTEALMETRLGKLINDVRKRSTDEDLVKRLKSLVRSWQKLAGENEATGKDTDTSISIRAEFVSRSTQTFRTFLHSNINPRAEKSDGSAPDKTMNYPTRVRRSKIPVRAVNPYSSNHISTKQCSASTSLRTSLSNQPSQDHIVRYLHMHESQKHRVFSSQCSTRNLFVTGEPALSTSTASKSAIQNNNIIKPALKKYNLFSISEVFNPTGKTSEDTQRNQHSNLTIKPNQHHTEDSTKPPNNASIITHDHHTQQSEEGEVHSSEKLNKSLCFVQETESSEMSQDKRIKSDIQNSLLSSKCHISGVNLFVAEKDDDKECRRTNVFIPDFIVTDFPGVSRDLTETDLRRIHHQRWHGVNGCYDNRNNWYDWTQSMELDSYGDGNTLKISPYVCIDYRLI